MRIYSHKGCQTCIVQARCTSVCDAYKKSLKRKYGICIEDDMPLEDAERGVAEMMVDVGHAEINIGHGSKLKYNKLFGLSIELDVETRR